MKVLVYQYVYVAADKTRTFVVLFDGITNKEIESRHFSEAAYPLRDIAHEMSRFVSKAVKAALDPDEITFSCNILGTWKLTKNDAGKYSVKTIKNRHSFDNNKGASILAPAVEDEMQEDEDGAADY